MKKGLFLILLIPGMVWAGVLDGHTWYNGSGFVKVSSHSPVNYFGSSYDRSISFYTPDTGESGSSDMCSVTGANVVSCIGGSYTLSYDPSQKTAHLSDKYGMDETFYEKGSEPTK